MAYSALATDYDGTLARDGLVDDATWASVERLKASGRKIILVTGRELEELLRFCPRIDLFDLVVVENGALLYRPSNRTETPLCSRPPDSFVESLRRKGVGPISVGRVIVATWEPHRWTVDETIREHGLDLRVIPNKAALMILPTGIDKASGLIAAMNELGLTLEETIGVGDAENDLAMLEACGYAVAVSNALPAVKERADFVTNGDRGNGVAELIGRIIEGDLIEAKARS
jgi:hydroxymethylpyrimidine pyrophosphatase-like HAD family hydrolase